MTKWRSTYFEWLPGERLLSSAAKTVWPASASLRIIASANGIRELVTRTFIRSPARRR